ncbi:MAG: hypothetical protein Q9166_007405 [cf. Caloplaca sp. 2 TL-2023]
MVGAVINEALRLFTILPFIAKCVPRESSPQPLKLSNNSTHMIPSNTLILINTSAIHRHPRHWPRKPNAPVSAKLNPLADFNPEFWLKDGQLSEDKRTRDPATGFLLPNPGTFVPFSDGIRGCLGKKFALVELVALVSRIFGKYSVEMAVEEDVAALNTREKRKTAWEKARRRTETALYKGVAFKLSLRLASKMPVVFVERGKELFVNL